MKKEEELVYQEKNLNGTFEVYESYIKILYPNSGFNQKEYIIDFEDINRIEIKTDVVPLIFKNLHIYLNDNTHYNFCIKKTKINEWNEIINGINDNLKNDKKIIHSKVQKNNSNHFVKKTNWIIGLVMCIILIMIYFSLFGFNIYTKIMAVMTFISLFIFEILGKPDYYGKCPYCSCDIIIGEDKMERVNNEIKSFNCPLCSHKITSDCKKNTFDKIK